MNQLRPRTGRQPHRGVAANEAPGTAGSDDRGRSRSSNQGDSKKMIRNMKALGLAVISVLAMGAISASAASAVEFHSEALNTTYKATGDGEQVFVTPAGTVTCTNVTGSAKTTA